MSGPVQKARRYIAHHNPVLYILPMYDIGTIEELIHEFGGPTKMGNWLGISQEAVSAFTRRGVPTGWHLRIAAELKRRGRSFDARAIFGADEDDAKVLFPRPLNEAALPAA